MILGPSRPSTNNNLTPTASGFHRVDSVAPRATIQRQGIYYLQLQPIALTRGVSCSCCLIGKIEANRQNAQHSTGPDHARGPRRRPSERSSELIVNNLV